MYKKMCIFDLDGTLNLRDHRLSVEIIKLSKMGVDFIVSTGRSNSYVINTFKNNGIIPPRNIIADNGGSIYDTRKKEFLRKTLLSTDKRKALINEFFRLGGKAEDIRFSDGNTLYVADDDLVKKYYANDSVIYYPSGDLVNELLSKDVDVIKITLAARRGLLRDLVRFARENRIPCFTDAGKTAFPIKERENYRLDITDSEMSKGEGVKFLVEHLGIRRFVCVGNGLNDFSMFKYAMDTGNKVLVVSNYENGTMSKESEELIEKTGEYARQTGKSDCLIFTTYPANGQVGLMEEQEHNREIERARISQLRHIKDRKRPNVDTKKGSIVLVKANRRREERER